MFSPDLTELVRIPSVWQRLERVEERLVEVTESEDPFLTKISRHLIAAGGKRYRPLLAQVAAELGDAGSAAVEAGVAVELVHVGSLYHDDVIDEADERRGAASVNANWSNTVAILAGDFLLARASQVAAPLGEEAVTLIARTYATLVEGQMLELQLSEDTKHGPDEYFRVIGGKSASLIRTSARLGALAAGVGSAEVEAVSDWAWEMGLVFQMTDDLLDLLATEQQIGKPAGSDITEGTFTLAVLYALAGPEGDDLRAALGPGKPYPPEAVAKVIAATRAGGYVERVLDEARAHLAAAAAAAQRLPDGPIPHVLEALGRYLVARVEAIRGG